MRPRKGNGTRADDKGDEVHDSSQSLYTVRIRKKRRSREQAADEKILRKDDGGIEGEQGGSSCVGGILHDAYRIVCHRSAGRRNGPAGSLCSCSDRKYIH